MTILRANADIATTGWASTTGQTTLYNNLGSTTTAIHRNKSGHVRERRKWYLLFMDDARRQILDARLSGNCLRTGQRAMQTTYDELYNKGAVFRSHVATLGPCWTARCELHSGMFFANHNMTAHDTNAATYISDYDLNYVTGGKSARPLNPNLFQWTGPWDEDLAIQFGYGRKRTTHAQQLTDGSLRADSYSINNATWNSGTSIMEFDSTTRFFQEIHVGDTITSQGFTPSGYNGTWVVSSLSSGTIGSASGTIGVLINGTSNPGASSASVNGTVTVPHDREDDLQVSTGWFGQQLERECVPVGVFGKWSNPRDRTDPIPAGISRCTIQLEDGPNSPVSDNTQYNLWVQDFTMNDTWFGGTNNLNPYSGSGYYNSNYATVSYSPHTITSITWSANVATVQCSTATGLGVGDQVTINTNSNGYDGTYVVNSLVSPPSTNVFTIATTNSTTGGGGAAYNRELYAPFYYWQKIKAWRDQMDESQPFFTYIATRLPHDNNGGYNASTAEKEYTGCVAESDAQYWLGTPSATSPVEPGTGISAGNKTAYADTHQMLASMDDLIRNIIDYETARGGPDSFGIILSSDQGIQMGEQGGAYTNADGDSVAAFGDGAGKTFIWGGSANVIVLIRGPQFGEGTTQSFIDRPTCHADTGPTLLELYGITDHHWLTIDGNPTSVGTRDGRSLLRIQDPSDVAYNRIIPIFGDFKTGVGGGNRGWGILDQNGRKFVELNDTKSSGKFMWQSPNIGAVTYNSATFHPAYEQKLVSLTTSDLNTYDSKLATAMAFRYDVVNETNPAHTTVSP